MERGKNKLICVDLASGTSMSAFTIWHLSEARKLGMKLTIGCHEYTPKGCLRIDNEVTISEKIFPENS